MCECDIVAGMAKSHNRSFAILGFLSQEFAATLASVLPLLPDLDAIYTNDWKDRIRDYFAHGAQFAPAAAGYWAFDFERQWAKHREGVRKELRLADALSHWMPLAGRRILVMGSWLGAEAIAYALCGADVTAIDLDEAALRLSEELAARYNVSLQTQVVDACRTGLPDETFDLVSCSQVLEHLPPDRQPMLLAEMWRVCKPGGLLWLDTPNQHNYRDRHDTGLPLIHWLPRPVKTRLARWIGRDVPTNEPAFEYQKVGLHYYLSYFGLMRMLRRLGPYEVLSRYRGYADVAHYAQQRRREGRAGGALFPLKLLAMRMTMVFWNFNWLSDIRIVVRKRPPVGRIS